MAIYSSNQYKYSGKGPLDAKSLVKTFADLTNAATWYIKNSAGKDVMTAYNGMITAVWLDKDETKQLTDKNGIYFLFDNGVTGTLKDPDVTNAANWHRLGGLSDLPGLNEQIIAIQAELETVKDEIEDLQDSATVVIEPGQSLPKLGLTGKLYVVLDEATTYVWYNGAYMPVGDGVGDSTPDIQIIYGGKASAN